MMRFILPATLATVFGIGVAPTDAQASWLTEGRLQVNIGVPACGPVVVPTPPIYYGRPYVAPAPRYYRSYVNVHRHVHRGHAGHHHR